MAALFKRYGSVGIAGVIVLVLVVWMASGMGENGHQAEQVKPLVDENTTDQAEEKPVLTVKVTPSNVQTLIRETEIYARSEAIQTVQLRARTGGVVTRLHVAQGEGVAGGEKLISLSADDRPQRLTQAKASLEKASAEYKAKQRLAKSGYQSDTQIATAKAELAAAEAALKRIQDEITFTSIKSPFNGVLESRSVEIGDVVQAGTVMGKLIRADKALIVGEVSEQEVVLLKTGQSGYAELSDGSKVSGELRFISREANPNTRTFRVELEVDMTGKRFISGLSARMKLPLEQVSVHQVASGALTLNDAGTLGLKSVNSASRVVFHPIEIIKAAGNTLWVTGLPNQANIITTGQGFVRANDLVGVEQAS